MNGVVELSEERVKSRASRDDRPDAELRLTRNTNGSRYSLGASKTCGPLSASRARLDRRKIAGEGVVGERHDQLLVMVRTLPLPSYVRVSVATVVPDAPPCL